LQIRRQIGDVIDIGRQELHVEQPLQPGDDLLDVEREHDAADGAEQRSDHADRHALDDEHAHHRRRAQAHGLEDGDIGLLVGDQHDQRRDNVECRDDDDQRQDDEHHGLFQLHGAEPVGVLLGPVAHPVEPGQFIGQLQRDHACPEQVGELQPDTGHPVAGTKQRLGIAPVNHGQRRVEFADPGLEDPGDREPAHLRQHAGGSGAQVGREDRHRIPGTDRQPRGQLDAEHDLPALLGQRSQAAGNHVLAEPGHRVLQRRIDAAHQRAGHVATLEQGLLLDERCGADDFRVAPGQFDQFGPVLERPIPGRDRGMRNHAQDALAQFLLEAVHHRDHGDQDGHADGDTGHRNQRDERNKMIAPLGAQVAQPDRDAERLKDQVFESP